MEPTFFTTVERMEEVSDRLLQTAKKVGIDTWEDRKKNQTPSCYFGEGGICCKICSMGPCRITPKAPKGICGATADTIAGRNYLRMVAAGAATHSDHGREICRVLYNADPNGSYKITDVAKLQRIAKEWGVETENRDIYDVAREVAYTGLMEYGKPFGKLNFLERANEERKKVWEENDVEPGAVDKEVVKAMHMTHMGNTADAEALVHQGLRTGMSDGWGGSMMGTEFSDVLFGIYQRGERLDYSSVSQSLRGVLVVALFSLGLGVFKSLELAMLGMFVGGVLVTLLYDVWHAKRFTELAPYIKRSQTFALLRECLPVVLATLFSNAVVSVARQHFGETYGAELLGKYASVATPAVLVQALSQFLFTPVLVPLSRKWAEGSGFVAYLTKSLGLTVVLVIAVVVLVALAGPWLLTTVYGPSIADSIYLLPGVLVCTVLLALSRFLCDTLVVCRNMRGVLVSNALALVACLVLMTPIEAGQGAQGINIVVALATLAGIVASVVALVLSIRRRSATQEEAS